MAREVKGRTSIFGDDGLIWKKRSTIWVPQIEEDAKISLDKIKRELDVEKEARDDARKDQPPASDRALNEPQLKICNRVFGGILLLNQLLLEGFTKALREARAKRPQPIDGDDYRARIANAVDEVFHRHEGEVRSRRQEDLQAQKDLRHFQNENRLNRQAQYPDSIILPIGIMLVCVILESTINGFILSDVMANGVAQGAGVALFVSALNVGLGFIAGYFGWRHTRHVALRSKVLGWLCLAVCHSAALLLNLAFAHFRQAAEQAAADPNYDFDLSKLSDTAYHQLSHSLTSFLAWGLLVLGLIIHFFATYEGHSRIEDTYPGYKKADQLAGQKRRAFDETLSTLNDGARRSAGQVVADAEAAGADASRLQSEMEARYEEALLREKEVRDSEDKWVAGGTELLKVYRETNVEVRGEAEPPPAYFDTYPDAVAYRRRQYGGEEATDEVDRSVAATRQVLDDLASLRTAGEQVIERNGAVLRELRAEINAAVAQLGKKIAGAKAAATNEALRAMREAGRS